MKTNQMNTKHISHWEDLILIGDLSVLDFFNGDYEVSLKIDGSPSIVWGTNPMTGNFFVGTKSVFNKVKLKINESHEDIDANHSGNVAQILHCCLDSLPRTEYIYQGDFIGFQGSKEYTPNTITYQFPEVVRQTIIVAPHTCYYAESDIRDAVAMPDRAIGELIASGAIGAKASPANEDCGATGDGALKDNLSMLSSA